MKTINITLNKENIEKYLETSVNVENLFDAESKKSIPIINTEFTCYNFANKALNTLRLYAREKKFYKLYHCTTVNGEVFWHLHLKKNADTEFLFKTFDKLGVPLSVLTLECSEDYRKLNLSNLLLKYLERLGETQRVQLLIYLISIMYLFVSFAHEFYRTVTYNAATDSMYISNSDLATFINISVFNFKDIILSDCAVEYNITQINTDDYSTYTVYRSQSTIEDYTPFNPEYYNVTFKCVKFTKNKEQCYGVLLRVNGAYTFMSNEQFYSEIYREDSMCYLTFEGDIIHGLFQKYYNITPPFFKSLNLLDIKEFSDMEYVDMEELEDNDDAIEIYNLVCSLQKEFTNFIEKIPSDVKEHFPIDIKIPVNSKYDLSSEYKDDPFAQELYKQVQPYYENFDLKTLEHCLKGFVSPNGIYAMLFVGDTGTGKSTAAKVIPTRCGMPFVSVNFSTNLEESDIIGTMIPNPTKSSAEDPEFIWQDGILTKAVRNGYVFNAEEINFARPGVLSKLNSLLDEYRQIDLPTGEIVKAHKNFRLIATCNIAYEGTNRFNKALINRFEIVHIFKELNKTELFNVITQRTGYKDVTKMETIYNVYEAIQKYSKEQNLNIKISVRQMLNIFTKGLYYKNALEAVKDILLNGAFIEDEEYKQFFEDNVLTAFPLNFKL